MMPSANFAAQPDFSAKDPSNGFQPGHTYSQSSPDMSGLAKPSVPRQVMNPFEEEADVEVTSGKHRNPEGAGMVAPSRQKFSRANTA